MSVLKLALILVITVFDLISYQSLVQAYPLQNLAKQQQEPPLEDRPPTRQPAGTRGPCEKTEQPFTPLLPLITNSEYKFYGFTLKEHPEFWFFIPYQTTSISKSMFFIKDKEQKTSLYQVSLELPETPGFVKISLPTTAKPLNLNEQYFWQFTLYCASDDPTDSSQNVSHYGLIERLAPEESELNETAFIERIQFYQEHRLWYDISANLGEIYHFPADWRYLFQVIGLDQLQQESSLGSAQPVQSPDD